jgi:2-polyprenyl-3-methyl-5-hydroxy-6-metoxy-1,4-benzoquinol methylase
MDDNQVGAYWEGNAEAWARSSRLGCNVSRDEITMPAFLALLPEVAGLCGLDIGCGEGHGTRLLARRGATMTAVDIAPTFIRLAREEEGREPLGIDYREASALTLPFPDRQFDFVVAFMSFMDMPQQPRCRCSLARDRS